MINHESSFPMSFFWKVAAERACQSNALKGLQRQTSTLGSIRSTTNTSLLNTIYKSTPIMHIHQDDSKHRLLSIVGVFVKKSDLLQTQVADLKIQIESQDAAFTHQEQELQLQLENVSGREVFLQELVDQRAGHILTIQNIQNELSEARDSQEVYITLHTFIFRKAKDVLV